MTSTRTTDTDPIRRKILAAADRLLDGNPLRSTGRLNVSQLAVEAGIARWHLTHQHTDLKELFQARAKTAAASAEPTGYDKIKIEYAELRTHCAELEEQLKLYASVIQLLTLEKDATAGNASVTVLDIPPSRRTDR